MRGQFNRTVLHNACQGDSVSFVQYKADTNAQDNGKDTPLHVAYIHGKAAICCIVLKLPCYAVIL